MNAGCWFFTACNKNDRLHDKSYLNNSAGIIQTMKPCSHYLVLLVICILMLCLAFSAGCTQTSGTSPAPVIAPSLTPVPAVQPQGASPTVQKGGPITCSAGFTDCNGYCRDLTLDIGNCGGCGNTCPDNSACSGGQCMCKGTYSSCGNICKDLPSDAKNCGACGTVCPAGQVCLKGQCGVTCTAGKTGCGNTCADLASDPNNCGSCGIACPAGQVCNKGQCGVSCINNLKFCSGYCRDLTSDAANCGACGVVCPSGQTCQNGQCAPICTSGLTLCNGYCTNLLSDSTSCGSCGYPCGQGTSCSSGICTSVVPTVSWTGTWNTVLYGPLKLTQTGDSVSGTYHNGQYSLSGTLSNGGYVLTGSWHEGVNTGTFEFDLANNQNQFNGWWASGSQPIDKTKNKWDGSR